MTTVDELESGRLAQPLEFSESAFITGSGREEVTVWFPKAPPGYVSLGCIVTKKGEKPDRKAVRCLRSDLVNHKGFAGKAVWTWAPPKTGQTISFWPVSNQVGF